MSIPTMADAKKNGGGGKEDDAKLSEIFTYIGSRSLVHFFLHAQSLPIPAEAADNMCGQVCNLMIHETMLSSKESVLAFHVLPDKAAVKVRATLVTPIGAPSIVFPAGALLKTLSDCLRADRSTDETIMAIKVGHTGEKPFDIRGPLLLYELPAEKLVQFVTGAQSLASAIPPNASIEVTQLITTKPLTYLDDA